MFQLGRQSRHYGLGAVLAALAAVGLTAALVMGDSASAGRLATTAMGATTGTTTSQATTGETTTTATAPPNQTSPPTISGTPAEGQTLTTSNGGWSGSSVTYAYKWERCDMTGGSCAAISGATGSSYSLSSADVGNTLRSVVTATNSGGSRTGTSVPTAVVTAAVPAAPTPAAGCPAGSGSVQVAQVSAPARLQIASFSVSPDPVGGSAQTINVSVHVTDTCGQAVQGALVDVQAVPFNQFNSPSELTTDSGGNAQVTMQRLAGFPAARHQELLALFIRARKPGENLLAGISTRRLVSVTVNLAR